MEWGQKIRWTDFNGDVTIIETAGYATSKEATKAAIESATLSGWHPPKWWEYWRSGDTKPVLEAD